MAYIFEASSLPVQWYSENILTFISEKQTH